MDRTCKRFYTNRLHWEEDVNAREIIVPPGRAPQAAQ